MIKESIESLSFSRTIKSYFLLFSGFKLYLSSNVIPFSAILPNTSKAQIGEIVPIPTFLSGSL